MLSFNHRRPTAAASASPRPTASATRWSATSGFRARARQRPRQLRAAALQPAASERDHGSDPGSPARRPRARHRSSRPRQLAPRRPRTRRRPDAPARANPPVALRWAHGSRRSRWKLRFSAPTLSLLFSQRIFRDSEREAICLAPVRSSPSPAVRAGSLCPEEHISFYAAAPALPREQPSRCPSFHARSMSPS